MSLRVEKNGDLICSTGTAVDIAVCNSTSLYEQTSIFSSTAFVGASGISLTPITTIGDPDVQYIQNPANPEWTWADYSDGSDNQQSAIKKSKVKLDLISELRASVKSWLDGAITVLG